MNLELRNKNDLFYGMLYSRYKIFGHFVLFTKGDKRSHWFDSENLAEFSEVTMKLAEKGDVHINIALQDIELAEKIFNNKNPGKNFNGRGTEESACCVTSIFGDIDIAGLGHKEENLPPTLEDAISLLENLPKKPSMIVMSGGGIHYYLCLDKALDISSTEMKERYKRVLKALQKCVIDAGLEHDWKLDNVGNLAQMLRPAGTYNYKDPNNPKPVTVLEADEDIVYSFEELEAAFDIKDLKLPEKKEPQDDILNHQQYYAEGIVEKCEFIRYCRDSAAVLSEPYWFAMIGILALCVDGEEAIHRLSAPYDRYDFDATEMKIKHAREAAPRTCGSIVDITGGKYCEECLYRGRIHTPIVLGDPNHSVRYSTEELIEKASEVIQQLNNGDLGAHLTPESISIFAQLSLADQAEYARKYSEIKDRKVLLNEFKQAVSAEKKRIVEERRKNGDISNTMKEFLMNSPFPELIWPSDYYADESGVLKVTYHEDGSVFKKKIAYKPLIITKRFRDIDTGREEIELAWKDDIWHSKIVPREIIASSGKIIELAGDGLPLHSVNSNELILYLAALEECNMMILPLEITTSHLGWQGENGNLGFLLGKNLLSYETEKQAITFRGASIGDNQIADAFIKKGSLELWISEIKAVKDYPPVIAALYTSFASTLLEILGCPNFAFELAGKTSTGKTTALRIAASAFGCADEGCQNSLINSWNGTKVFSERASGVLNSLPIILDDSKLCKDPEQLSNIFYMISNGRGKGRGNTKGIALTRPIRTVLLSSAETPSVHRTHDGGLRGRILECTIPPFPARDSFLNTEASMREVVSKANLGVRSNYGHAGPIFIKYIIDNKARWDEWREMYRCKSAEYASKCDQSEVSGRLADYASAIFMAGKILHEALPLPWEFYDPMQTLWPIFVHESQDPTGEESCLLHCFSWAVSRKNEFATNYNKTNPPTGGWAGKWDSDLDDWKYIAFFSNVLERIIKDAGYEVEPMLRGWYEKGWLMTNKNDKSHRYTKQVKVNGANAWMTVIKREAFDGFNDTDPIF